MNAEKPFDKTEAVSEKNFNGYWIPRHNAKVLKEGIENNAAPFLPNANGEIVAKPVYDANTGYCLPAARLIPVQFEKARAGYESDVVGTKRSIDAAQTSIKAGEKGVFYNFKVEGRIHTTSCFFPEQTEQPQRLIDHCSDKVLEAAQGKYPQIRLDGATLQIDSAENYLATYIAACKSGAKLEVTPEITEQFKANMLAVADKELHRPNGQESEYTAVFQFADKKASEIIKSKAQELGIVKVPEKKREQTVGQER